MVASFVGLSLIPLAVLLLLDSRPRPSDSALAEQADPYPSRLAEETRPELSRSVYGTIRASGSDEPVAAATIAVSSSDRQVQSDAAGRYRLSGLPLGAVTLVISAPGYHDRHRSLPGSSAAAVLQLDIVLFTAPMVAGTVIDPAGDPVAGAAVRCEIADDGPLTATSDGDGRFELEPAAAGCRARAGHERFGSSPPARLRAGGHNVLQLSEPASISGVVVDETGSPVPRYSVAVESFRPADGSLFEAALRIRQSVVDDDGTFRLQRLRPGLYVLTAAAQRRPPARSQVIELGDGEQARGVRIVLTAGATLHGTVTDEGGDPIAGARVALDTLTITKATGVRPATTDADGYYEIDGVPEGLFSIVVAARGYRRRIISSLTTRGASSLEQDVTLTPRGDAGGTEYTGIGATLRPGAEGTIIATVITGGPAETAGVANGDVILRIDGVLAEDFTVAQCVQLLRGPVGSRVAMTLRRDGGEVAVVITRDHFVF